MKSIPIQSLQGRYTVLIGRGLLARAGRWVRAYGVFPRGIVRGQTRVLVVAQRAVLRLYGAPLRRSLEAAGLRVFEHELPEGERAKSKEQLFRIYQALLRRGFDRSDAIAALGGGVTGDLCGFAASTYLRGIALVNIATTLLAQVDSAVGGKTGINLAQGKNLIGTFYPARLVLADAGVLKTVPEREYRASLAEVVKYGVIRDPALFAKLEKHAHKILNRDAGLLAQIVSACVRIKARVVEEDERETKGGRMILNYGHTFGHAFEKALNYKHSANGLVHGEAVSIGMAAAAFLAEETRTWPRSATLRQKALLERLGLPVALHGLRLKSRALLQAMRHDKKKQAGRLRFVLPRKIGRVEVREDIAPRTILKILDRIGGL